MRIFNDKWRALITKPQLSKKEQITYREFEPKNPKFKKRSDYRLGISSFNLNFTDLICHPITIFSIGIRSLKIDQNELNYKYEQRTVIPIQSIKVLILKVIYQNLEKDTTQCEIKILMPKGPTPCGNLHSIILISPI